MKNEKINMRSSKYPIIEIYRDQNYKTKTAKKKKVKSFKI